LFNANSAIFQLYHGENKLIQLKYKLTDKNLTSPFMTRFREACSDELDTRVANRRIHCLILAIGANPQISLNSAKASWTESRKSVPSLKGCIAT